MSAALFDLASYEGEIVADLFEDNGYFASADQFWAAQQAEIDRRRSQYLEDGWNAVEIVPPERHFQSWEYERAAKSKGGRVYIDLTTRGEVTFHEGYLTRKEAQRRSGTSEADPQRPTRPEVTAAMNEYLDMHRRAGWRSRRPPIPRAGVLRASWPTGGYRPGSASLTTAPWTCARRRNSLLG